jgi:glycosyltransferase involved in cell wall biosynthesis
MFMPGLRADALGASVHQAFAADVNALGHEFRILTTEPHRRDDRLPLWEELAPAPRWRAIDALAAPWVRTRSIFSPAASLARYLRNADGLDLLHVEVAYPFGAAALIGAAAAGWRGPIAVTPMGEDTLIVEEAHYGFRRYPLPRWLVGRVLSAAACIRCISPLHERIVAPLAPKTPRRVIPLNVSTAVVQAARESAQLRGARRKEARATVDDELGSGGRPLVLSLGRLHAFKGIDFLVRAMHDVPDALLIVAGPSLSSRSMEDERTRLARLVGELGLGDRVRFLGGTTPDRALQLLAAADVVAVPSRLESLNKVCVEATAVGTPFVVTETTGIAHWAQRTGIGLVVPACDPPALAAGIIDALRRPPALSPERIASFVDLFSPRTVAAAVIEFYEEMLGRR